VQKLSLSVQKQNEIRHWKKQNVDSHTHYATFLVNWHTSPSCHQKGCRHENIQREVTRSGNESYYHLRPWFHRLPSIPHGQPFLDKLFTPSGFVFQTGEYDFNLLVLGLKGLIHEQLDHAVEIGQVQLHCSRAAIFANSLVDACKKIVDTLYLVLFHVYIFADFDHTGNVLSLLVALSLLCGFVETKERAV